MQGAIYSIVTLILIVVIVLLIKFSKIQKKRRFYSIGVIACLALSFFLDLFPIENLFYDFPTVEAAFSYRYGKGRTILVTVEGNESTYIASYDSNASTQYNTILSKTEKGWKIDGAFDTDFISSKTVDYYNIIILRHKKTQEFYICVSSLIGNPAKVSDNQNSEFETGEKNTLRSDCANYLYCAFIDSFDINTYVLYLNGKEVSLSEFSKIV